jgi:hypothetical protein
MENDLIIEQVFAVFNKLSPNAHAAVVEQINNVLDTRGGKILYFQIIQQLQHHYVSL